ncbi:uncharacterized protein F4822DRAFT_385182 [Hypoxylon trugodes]|uniref:uncharacterized protein n=1 Tax=Hypoxylon trugodes TaxID=326681 RepID=UPI002197AAEF|nr:uncharacterized protein F4822DRAFT_385182 [Hypoxylon trugodes]KAI1393595.1 hypothetical protein F4822DRAFT_385182 [Hypoxylon trugodes]
MAISNLPTIPLVVFGVLEPAMLIWAYIVALRDTPSFYIAQAPNFPLPADAEVPPHGLVLLLQLVNVYVLLAAIAVVCSFTPHASVSRGYLIAVAFADYGHIWAVYKALGAELFWDVGSWNDMIWGSIAVSAVLNVLRWLTVAGAFGALRDARDPTAAAAGVTKKRA